MNQVKQAYVEPNFESRTFHRCLEWAAVTTFPFLSIAVFYFALRIWQNHWWQYLSLLAAALVGYVLADLLSGFVHWAADTYGSEDTPIFGPNFIQPFRWHHIAPKAMCEHNLAGTIGNSCMLAIGLQAMIVSYFLSYPTTSLTMFGALLLNFMAIFTVFANQFHKWSHSSEKPRWVVKLQQYHIILPPGHHDVHHSVPFNDYYCVASGWCNPVLSKIKFWRSLEKMLALVGIHPDASASVSPDIEIESQKPS